MILEIEVKIPSLIYAFKNKYVFLSFYEYNFGIEA